MRPLQLKMAAFGPYHQETVVDFEKFNSPIFIITGETGAGKTMIFDAICVALYGKSSGDRTIAQLHCDKASEKEKMRVELRFSLHNKVYIAKREFRGGNTSAASLQEEDGPLYKSGANAVNKEINDLIGIDFDSFRMTMMIAQGKFENLINAEPNKRKAIFREILSTGHLLNFAERLSKKAKEMQGEILTIETASIARLQGFYDPDESFVSSLKEKGHDANILLNTLQNRLNGQKEHLSELKKSKEEDERVYNAAEAALSKGEKDAAAFLAYQKDLASFASLEEKKPSMEALRKEVEKKEGVLTLTKEKERLDKDCFEKQNKEKVLADSKAKLPRAKDEASKANAVYESLKQTTEPTLEKKQKEAEALRQAIGKVEKRDEAKRRLDEDETSREKQKKVKEELSSRIASLDELIKSHEENVKAFDGFKRKEAASLRLQNAENAEKRMQGIAESLKKLLQTRADYERTQADTKAALMSAEKAKRDYDECFKQFTLSEAGLLASTLVAGEPCPVCGSRDHPAPHHHDGEEAFVSREVLAEKRRIAEEKETECNSLSSSCKALGAVMEERKKSIVEELKQTGVYDEAISLEENVVFACKQAGAALSNAQNEAKLIDNEIDSFNKAIAEIDLKRTSKKAKEEELAQTEKALVALETKIDSEKKELARLVEETSGKSKEELIKGKESLDGQIDAAKKALDDALKQKNKSERDLASLEATLNGQIRAFNDAKERYESEKAEYERKLSEQGLPVDAPLPLVDVASLQKDKTSLANFDREHQTLTGALQTHRAAGADKIESLPDLDALRKEKDEKKATHDASFQTYSSFFTSVLNNEKMLKEVAEDLNKYKVEREKYIQVSRLSETVNGKVGQYKVDFETYCMLHAFDRVLVYASRRFMKMSDDRYEFVRKDPSASVKRGFYGLSLEVNDNHNGTVRDATGLSGGEKFEASLSLALSFSEAMQSNKGGIELNSMFIDEGFGTLSPNIIAKAMEVLHELSMERDSLVGLISHVEQLESAIDSKLVVTKEADGAKITQYV